MFQNMHGISIISLSFDDEFDLIMGLYPLKIVWIIVQVHQAGRAFNVHDPDAAAVDSGNIETSIGFHQNCAALIQKVLDQSRGCFLKQRLSTSNLNQRFGWIRCNLSEYLGHRHIHAFVISIPGIAIDTPQIASSQADEYTGESGIQGFPLDAVKYFIYFKCHKKPLTKYKKSPKIKTQTIRHEKLSTSQILWLEYNNLIMISKDER